LSTSPEHVRPDRPGPPSGPPSGPRSGPRGIPTAAAAVGRWPGAVGRFVWDFVVGDTPELAVGAVLVVVVVALLAHNGAARPVTVAAMPVLVTLMLGASVRRARRSGSTPPVEGPTGPDAPPGG